MIDPVTGWFEIVQYDNKKVLSISNLVESTWLFRYPRPIEITYHQGSEFIGNEFRKFLIEYEYRITAKPSTLLNPISNAVLERIHQVLGKLVRTFNIYQTQVDKNDPWTGILSATAFAICSTTNHKIVNSLGQLVFGRDMIIPIKHKVDWELIRLKNQTQINRDNIHKNRHRVDYDYKVEDNVTLTKHTAYKYKIPCTGPFLITQCFTNGTVNLQCGAIQIKYDMCHINTNKSDTKVEDSSSKICMMMLTYELPVIYFYLKPNIGTEYMIGYKQGHWR